MKIVLDTNVLVSGLLNPYGAPGRMVLLVADGKLSLCFDARIIAEYRAVLFRPVFSFRPDHVSALIEQIRTASLSTASAPLPHPLPDRDDEAFLEAAIAGAAEYLVTGNPRHFPARSRRGIEVVSPAEFLELYRTKQA